MGISGDKLLFFVGVLLQDLMLRVLVMVCRFEMDY